MKHCIVTPEIPPFTKNGGVGTNALNLCTFLQQTLGQDVTLLSTRPTGGNPADARELIQKRAGAAYFALEEFAQPWSLRTASPSEHARSINTYYWLRDQQFDVIHLMQYECSGFASIRAKRLGKSFHDSQLVLILNSPMRWLDDRSQRQHNGSSKFFLLDYMERYCVEHADVVVSPTQSMFDWFKEDGWTVAADARVIPTYNPQVPLKNRKSLDPNHLVFYGRLETRKGLELFTAALLLLAEDGIAAERDLTITFLGKVSAAGGKSSATYLKEKLRALPANWKWEMLTNFSRAQALEYLETHSGSVYLIPSLSDNSPNTLLECLGRNLYLLCSDTPGVGDLCVGCDPLFPTTPQGLAERLQRVFREGLEPAQPATSQQQVIEMRTAFIEQLHQRVKHSRELCSTNKKIPDEDFVSVIIPHYNLGKYLPEAIRAVEQQSHPRFEIIVVDDGSTDPLSIAVLRGIEARSGQQNLRVIRQKNAGVCSARNTGASHARGNLIAFVDADNVPLPHMLESMNGQLRAAGIDCLTCNLYKFEEGEEWSDERLQPYAAFAGGCLEAAIHLNCLGDSNLLVGRQVFLGMGGFRSSMNEASADRAFLIRLLRAGHSLDCTDDRVLAYRRRDSGMSRADETYHRARTVLEAYCENQEPWAARLIEASFPVYRKKAGAAVESNEDSEEVDMLKQQLEVMKSRYMVEREKRRARHKKANERYRTLLHWRSNVLVRIARNFRLIERDY